MWQELRSELHPQGIEVVTVALDAGGADAAGPWIDAAAPEHPSLIDADHALDAALGVVNVPTGVWVNAEGILVRPPEVAHPGRSVLRDMIAEHGIPSEGPQILLEQLREASRIRVEPTRYAAALRDWARLGDGCRHVLPPEEVVARSRPRPPEHSRAAAHFELARALWDRDEREAARAHFREAHRLDPENWTYKRQAWTLEDPLQGPTAHYDSDWVSEVRARGPETYYELPEL